MTSEYSCDENRCFDYDYPSADCNNDGDETNFYKDGVVPIKTMMSNIVSKADDIIKKMGVMDHLKEI